MLNLILLVIGVVAGYYSSEWYMKNYSWKHSQARLFSIIIFLVVMNVTYSALNILL